MCGVCGFVAFQRSAPRPGREAVLETMLSTLTHRGPDQRGMHFDAHVALGQTRLSIIDLSTGQQPLCNEDRTIWLVFNGEIYNFKELRADLLQRGHVFKTNTDGETIIHLYEECGDDFIRRLNGMFAFALWDGFARRLILGRDRFGMKPLHYCTVDGTLVFASEIKALLSYPGLNKAINPLALDQYLTYEYVPAPASIFTGIHKLEGGKVLTFTEQGEEIHSFWTLDPDVGNCTRSAADQLEQWLVLMERAVHMRLVSDVPVGLLLSGGLDSTAVLYYMRKLYPGTVQTFSVGFAEDSYDELKHVQVVCDHFGVPNHNAIFGQAEFVSTMEHLAGQLDEPLGDASLAPTLFLSRLARGSVKVALSGDGADELLAGYPTYFAHRIADLYDRVPPLAHHGIISRLAKKLPLSERNFSWDFCLSTFLKGYRLGPRSRHTRWMGAFSRDERRCLLHDDMGEVIEQADEWQDSWSGGQEKHSAPLAAQLMDFQQYLPDDILVKMDRASMMASLEVRAPFLDNDLVDFAWSLPECMKSRGMVGKWILRKAMARKLPASTLRRGKKGFGLPLAAWLKHGATRAMVAELPRGRLVKDGYLRAEPIQELLDEHWRGERNNRKKIYTLLSLSSWYDNFF